MKRMLLACLGMAAVWSLLPSRGLAQPADARVNVSIFDDQFHSSGYTFRTGCESSAPEFDKRFRQWVLGLQPAARRELVASLVLGIHPLMTFVPGDACADLPADHSIPTDRHYQVLPFVVQEVGPDGSERLGMNIVIPARCGFLPVAEETPYDLGPVTCGVSCPYLVKSRTPPPPPCFEPPEVLANLDRLMKAEQLLKQGEELSRAGHFYEAADCFQEVHQLVPGTNLEARAGAATENLLVKVYGTATENGVVDEQSEPSPDPAPTPAPAWPAPTCAKCLAAPAACTEHAKLQTIVYSISDLLGKGKETKLADFDDLLDVITTTVNPKAWNQNGGEGTIAYHYRSRAIVIYQTTDVHDQVAELLAGLRQAKAQSESIEAKQHAQITAELPACANEEAGCCEDCPREMESPAHTATESVPSGCCIRCCSVDSAHRECCNDCTSVAVLTLATEVAAKSPEEGSGLELVVEDCTVEAENPVTSKGWHWGAGGICSDTGVTADGLRFRWQVPIGSLTVLVQYDHRELTVGLGVAGDAESAAEESETPH